MPRSLARLGAAASSHRNLSSAVFITDIAESDFSVHTGASHGHFFHQIAPSLDPDVGGRLAPPEIEQIHAVFRINSHHHMHRVVTSLRGDGVVRSAVDLCVSKIRFGIDGGDRRDKLAASDDRSVQADSGRPSFALQVKSKAGSRNPGSTATDQCASPTGVETTALQQYRSFSVCLALSLVPLCPWRHCDCQAGDHHSLAPRQVSGVLALAITQPRW